MSPEAQQFLNSNASAVFGLIGALGGGVLSFVASLLLKRREFSLQLRSKIIDRQIAAHERILKLAQDMRVMGSTGALGPDGEVLRGYHRDDLHDLWRRYLTADVTATSATSATPVALQAKESSGGNAGSGQVADDGEVAQGRDLDGVVAHDFVHMRAAGPARRAVDGHRAGAAHADAAGKAVGERRIERALDVGDHIQHGLAGMARDVELLKPRRPFDPDLQAGSFKPIRRAA